MASRPASEDTEITLGTGRLLGLFFLLAAVCGAFFAIGYSLGKSSAREQALNDQAAPSSEAAKAAEGGKKPSAIVAVKGKQPAQDETASAKGQNDLTFYKSVQQDQPDTKLTQAAVPQAASTTKSQGPPAPEPEASPKPAAAVAAGTPVPTALAGPGSEAAHTTSGVDRGAFMVQIAAVTKQEDAQALADALKKKSYSVFVVNNPSGTDKLFHVQVGPFSSLPDAEAMKVKLTSDGYNPIVKR